MNIKNALEAALGKRDDLRLNNIDIDEKSIRAVMINEIVPEDPAQDFYGEKGDLYLSTVLPLFQ
ncbi:MAG: uracil-DNA glycosylase, partial [Clostridia bacterium]|nr:uracil-DNA glycosylase [Clostridia bacterium]